MGGAVVGLAVGWSVGFGVGHRVGFEVGGAIGDGDDGMGLGKGVWPEVTEFPGLGVSRGKDPP